MNQAGIRGQKRSEGMWKDLREEGKGEDDMSHGVSWGEVHQRAQAQEEGVGDETVDLGVIAGRQRIEPCDEKNERRDEGKI